MGQLADADRERPTIRIVLPSTDEALHREQDQGRRWWILLSTGATVLLAALVVTACSSEPAPEKSPQLAMQQITSLLPMSDEQAACVRAAIEAKPGLASILNVKAKPTTKRIKEFNAAMVDCIPVEELAEILARLAAASASSAPGAQQCVRDQIIAMNEEDRALFLMIQLNGNALSGSDQLRVEQVTLSVIGSCNLANATPPDGTGLLPPDGGATQLSR
ncbi:MAG: hypothetical protein N2037_10455 [Acidimicrobiales bacterium]|nr:hypothetical protein [Acidimicrobiales bacterium]